MNRLHSTIVVAALAWLAPTVARAHITVASGPGIANTSQEVAFGVGHGCAGADTYRVEIEIPTGVTSVRPETSDFGQVDVATDDAGTIVMVSWQKSDAALLPADTQYYKLAMRLKTPDAPFTTLYFPARQICRAEDGTTTVVEWVGLDAGENADIEPAPALRVVPPRFPGWINFTLTQTIDDLSVFFADAQIVWRGDSAYSVNPTTIDLIAGTDGTTLLETLSAGHEIWVKY